MTIPNPPVTLQPLSRRPTLLVDGSTGLPFGDVSGMPPPKPSGGQYVLDAFGVPNILGLFRMVDALPLADGPRLLLPAAVTNDSDGTFLADPDGNIIGANNAIWISRVLTAVVTPNTRRL